MSDDQENPKTQPITKLYSITIPAAFTIVTAVLLVLHFMEKITLDSPVITLIGAAALLWFLPLVTKIRLGDNEIELGQRVAEVEAAQKAEAEKVDVLFENVTEVDDLSDPDVPEGTQSARAMLDIPVVEGVEKAVLLGLDHPQYTLRTVRGVSRAVSKQDGDAVDRPTVERALERLKDQGLTRTVPGKSGTPVWGLTQKGRLAVAALQ